MGRWPQHAKRVIWPLYIGALLRVTTCDLVHRNENISKGEVGGFHPSRVQQVSGRIVRFMWQEAILNLIRKLFQDFLFESCFEFF